MESFNVGSAVDDLHSQLTPSQFSYLLSVISPPVSLDDSSLDKSIVSSNFSLSASTTLIPYEKDGKNKKAGAAFNTATPTKYKRSSYLPIKQRSPAKSSPGEGSSLCSLVSPILKETLQVHLPQGILQSVANLQMSSFETTRSSRSSQSKESGESMEVACSSEENKGKATIKKLSYADMKQIMSGKKNQKVVPLIEAEEKQRERLRSTSSCSQLAVCKRTVNKLTLGSLREEATFSRSSSMETIRAKSPPDEDSAYKSIAGKIANEPVNPFPTLKQATYSVSQRLKSKKRPSLLDAQRFDQEIQQLFQKSEDYKDLSKFFSENKTPAPGQRRGRSNSQPPLGAGASIRLSRRVTNPLYKVYDPKGYTKTDDELALECIEMVCDDFNSWINSLDNCEDHPAKKFASASVSAEKREEQPPFQIGPDFLLRILRKEIEFPEAP